jgi:hypothetical protein
VVEGSLAKPVQDVHLASGVDEAVAEAVAEPVQNAVSEVVAAERSDKEGTDSKAGEVGEKIPEGNTATQQETSEQGFTR